LIIGEIEAKPKKIISLYYWKRKINIPFEPIEAFQILKNSVGRHHCCKAPLTDDSLQKKKRTKREIWPNAAYFRPSTDYGQVNREPASWRKAQWITFRTIPLANLMESEIQENKMLETLSSEDGNGN